MCWGEREKDKRQSLFEYGKIVIERGGLYDLKSKNYENIYINHVNSYYQT